MCSLPGPMLKWLCLACWVAFLRSAAGSLALVPTLCQAELAASVTNSCWTADDDYLGMAIFKNNNELLIHIQIHIHQ